MVLRCHWRGKRKATTTEKLDLLEEKKALQRVGLIEGDLTMKHDIPSQDLRS